MNITIDLLKLNKFIPYPENTSYMYIKNDTYKIVIMPEYILNSNCCNCTIECEYYKDPHKGQKIKATNIVKISDFLNILKVFNIDFKFVV